MGVTLLLIVIGVAVGILGAVLGLGGGIIIVPVLVIGLKMPIHEAIAVSLVVITANSLSTSAVYIKNGLANMPLGILLAISSVIGAIGGSYVSVSLSQQTVMLILGVMQMFIAYLIYIRTKKTKQYIPSDPAAPKLFDCSYTEISSGEVINYTPIKIQPNTIFSFFSGIFSGLTGAGGGVLIIPGMNLISHMPIKAATATSAFIIGFTAATGAIVYIHNGFFHPETAASIMLGVAVGTAVAMRYLTKITDKKVSYIFIALLLCVSVQMIYRGLGL